MAESAESCSIVNDLPVVVTGGVAVVRRELAVQTNRFHSFGRLYRDGQSKGCRYKELVLYIVSLVLNLLKKLLDPVMWV